jgi:hypothetical protein
MFGYSQLLRVRFCLHFDVARALFTTLNGSARARGLHKFLTINVYFLGDVALPRSQCSNFILQGPT